MNIILCLTHNKPFLDMNKTISLVLLLMASIFVMSCSKDDDNDNKVEPEGITVELADDSYTEDGTISLGESFKVISEVSGPVQEVRVTENQTVKKGTVLYRIGSDDYSYELDVLKAQLAGYEAQFEKAKVGNVMTLSPEEYLEDLRKQKESAEASLSAAASTYTAYTGLFAAGDVAKTDYEGIRAEYENAEAA